MSASVDMERLEKLEFSGTRGGGLAENISNLQGKFLGMWAVFYDCEYNCLDINTTVRIMRLISVRFGTLKFIVKVTCSTYALGVSRGVCGRFS